MTTSKRLVEIVRLKNRHHPKCALMQPVKTEWTGDGYRLLENPLLVRCNCEDLEAMSDD